MRRRSALAIALVLAATVVGLLRGPRKRPATTSAPAPAPAPPTFFVDRNSPPPAAAGAVILHQGAEVARVLLDRPVVCPGETVLASVIPAPGTTFARVLIDGGPANPAVLSWSRPGSRRLSVLLFPGEDRTAAIAGSFEVTVKERCPPAPALELRHTLRPDRDSARFELTAAQGLQPPLRLEWDFGDGTTATGGAGAVEHSYALRPQPGPVSTFVVKVIARDQHGFAALGRLALSLDNASFLDGRRGRRVLPVEVDRFTAGSALRIRNVHGEPLVLASALVRAAACRDGRALEARAAAADLLGDSPRLSPGQIWSGRLSLPDRLFPEPACTADITIAGSTASGEPVTTRFALDLAVPRTGTERITDAATIARVRKAQALLGRRQVTLDEVDQLAREGKI